MVADIWSGPNESYPNYLTVMAGKLYFVANNGVNGQELWVYDPEDIVSSDATTDNPPRMVTHINSEGDSDP